MLTGWLTGHRQKKKFDRIALKYMRGNILDVACGTGRFINQDPGRIIGLDISRECIRACKNFSIMCADAIILPFKDSSIDSIHCSHFIEHLLPSQLRKLLMEMNRILKPGGILCIRSPLMYPGFYKDADHIRPYYPEGLFKYLQKGRHLKDFHRVGGTYKKIKLKFRRDVWLRKTGYMMILQKRVENHD